MTLKSTLSILAIASAIVASAGPKVDKAKPAQLAPGQVMSWDDAYARADQKLKELTPQEKAHFMRAHSDFYYYGVPSKGIPFLYLSDASQGVHIRTNLPDTSLVKQLDRSTAFPAPIMLTATFNPSLAGEYAKAIGEECRAGGIEVLLGPGVNITKNSQCGRNYEYLGEDPYLSGVMAANYIKGMQSTGTATCLKHFICNETEFYRRRSNSVVDERALHEIYMPPFRAGIEAGAPYVMTSYNMVNGEYAGQNRHLITDLLRNELGFRGAVMSDWRSVYDLDKVVESGQNSIMPGSRREAFLIDSIDARVASGSIPMAKVDAMIRPIIATGYAYGLYERPKYQRELLSRYPDHAATALKTAEEGTVLLRNNGILPLASDRKVLLAGKAIDYDPRNANNNPASSADVKGWDYVSLADALRGELGADRVALSAIPSDSELKSADVVLAVVETTDLESYERPFALDKAQEAFVRRAVALNPNTIVLVISGSGIRMTSWNDRAAAVIYGWYPGQNGMKAIAGVISGRVNPSGKLPMTIEREFTDSPAKDVMPKGAEFYTLAPRAYNEGLITPYDVNYHEGVLVGYRWYDTKGIDPLYHFGHGLSYTTFDISRPSVKVKGDKILVTATLTNTGSRPGAEVIQVYAGENQPTVTRPVKELKAFRKVSLAPGKSETVTLSIDRSALSFWNDATHSWQLNPGAYTLSIGTASDNIAATLPITLR